MPPESVLPGAGVALDVVQADEQRLELGVLVCCHPGLSGGPGRERGVVEKNTRGEPAVPRGEEPAAGGDAIALLQVSRVAETHSVKIAGRRGFHGEPKNGFSAVRCGHSRSLHLIEHFAGGGRSCATSGKAIL